MQRILVFLTLIMLFSFQPIQKKDNNQLSNVTLLYGTTTTPGCYGVFMYNYDNGMEYFFTFSGSYGTLGTVTAGTYFVSVHETTPYCDSYNNRTFQVGCNTKYNSGTWAEFYDIPINSGCRYVFVQ